MWVLWWIGDLCLLSTRLCCQFIELVSCNSFNLFDYCTRQKIWVASMCNFIIQLKRCLSFTSQLFHRRYFSSQEVQPPRGWAFGLGSFRHCSWLLSQIGEVCGYRSYFSVSELNITSAGRDGKKSLKMSPRHHVVYFFILPGYKRRRSYSCAHTTHCAATEQQVEYTSICDYLLSLVILQHKHKLIAIV